jgi:hypothetical protein
MGGSCAPDPNCIEHKPLAECEAELAACNGGQAGIGGGGMTGQAGGSSGVPNGGSGGQQSCTLNQNLYPPECCNMQIATTDYGYQELVDGCQRDTTYGVPYFLCPDNSVPASQWKPPEMECTYASISVAPPVNRNTSPSTVWTRARISNWRGYAS